MLKRHFPAQQVEQLIGPRGRALRYSIAFASTLFVSTVVLLFIFHFMRSTNEPVWPTYPAMQSALAHLL
jgi:hypothetical protein